jgi:hypothetical protein
MEQWNDSETQCIAKLHATLQPLRRYSRPLAFMLRRTIVEPNIKILAQALSRLSRRAALLSCTVLSALCTLLYLLCALFISSSGCTPLLVLIFYPTPWSSLIILITLLTLFPGV